MIDTESGEHQPTACSAGATKLVERGGRGLLVLWARIRLPGSAAAHLHSLTRSTAQPGGAGSTSTPPTREQFNAASASSTTRFYLEGFIRDQYSARVASADVLNFGGAIMLWPQTARLLDNIWSRLA